MTIAHRPPMRHAGRNLLVAVAGFGAATLVFGLSRSFPLSLAMLFLAGALDNISVVVRHTMVQLLTPDAMRGRVSAINSVFIGVSNELGGVESGLVAHWFGPVISVASGGIGSMAVVAVIALASAGLRRVGALEQIRAVDADPPGGRRPQRCGNRGGPADNEPGEPASDGAGAREEHRP
jgi:MFS family permease